MIGQDEGQAKGLPTDDSISRDMQHGACDNAEHRGEDNRPDCDFCGELAVVNYQKLWHKWNIDKAGDYEEDTNELLDNEPTGRDNLHLCEKHHKEYLAGNI
jgi:hypothetical protein